MRTKAITMGSLLLSIVTTTVATPAFARHRHEMQRQNLSESQLPMMAAVPEAPVLQQRRDERMPQRVAALGDPAAGPHRAGRSAPEMAIPGEPTRRQRRARREPAPVAGDQMAMGGTAFGDTSLVAEARHWIGGNPTGRSSLWCGNFMNFVLNRTGHEGSSSNMARSFASYGHRLPGPQVGAIAVMSRGHGGGHVGVVSGIDPNGNPIIISGNHGHRVGEGVYPRGRIYAYVSP